MENSIEGDMEAGFIQGVYMRHEAVAHTALPGPQAPLFGSTPLLFRLGLIRFWMRMIGMIATIIYKLVP